MSLEMFSQLLVMGFALWVGRTWLNLTAFMMILTFMFAEVLFIDVAGMRPDLWSEDFSWYMSMNFMLYFVFFFLFMFQVTKLSWSMAFIMLLQCAICFAFLVNGGRFDSYNFDFSQGIGFISELLNDILWKVECVIAWIAAYIARSERALGDE